MRMVGLDASFWQVSRTGGGMAFLTTGTRFLQKKRCATSIFLNPLGEDRKPPGWPCLGLFRVVPDSFVKGLILAQNERWRRGLGMQVERAWQQVSGARVSKATATNPMVGHSRGKLRVIPSDVRLGHLERTKVLAPWDGPSWY